MRKCPIVFPMDELPDDLVIADLRKEVSRLKWSLNGVTTFFAVIAGVCVLWLSSVIPKFGAVLGAIYGPGAKLSFLTETILASSKGLNVLALLFIVLPIGLALGFKDQRAAYANLLFCLSSLIVGVGICVGLSLPLIQIGNRLIP